MPSNRRVPDSESEVADVLACLRKSLSGPTFRAVLQLLTFKVGQSADDHRTRRNS